MSEETKSTHKCECVEIKLEPCPNSDFLSIVKVHGYTVVVNTKQWEGISRGVYIPPDSIVNTNLPEFSFLIKEAKIDGSYRVKAKKLRGQPSFGMLIPAPDGAELGQNFAEYYGVRHWEPQINYRGLGSLFSNGECTSAPNLYCPKYDVDAGRRYSEQMFVDGEDLIITEKLHGQNWRGVFTDGNLHIGSRTLWKKEFPSYSHITLESLEEKIEDKEKALQVYNKIQYQDKKISVWWAGLHNTKGLKEFLENHPDYIVYGEIINTQGGFSYGLKQGDVQVRIFDILHNGRWLDTFEAFKLTGEDFPWVPFINDQNKRNKVPFLHKFNADSLAKLAEGKTLMEGGTHIREGCIARPTLERSHPRLGRCVLKWVGVAYLEKDQSQIENYSEE